MEKDKILSEIKKFYAQNLIVYAEKPRNLGLEFLEHHSLGFTCGAITSNNKTLVIGGMDSVIRAWSIDKKKLKFIFQGHNLQVNCITVTGNSRYIISGSDDKTVRIWSIKGRNQTALLRGHESKINAICYINEKSLIISGDNIGDLVFWDFSKRIINKIIYLKLSINSFALMNTDKALIIGLKKQIAFIEIDKGNLFKTMDGHTDLVTTLCLTSNQEKLISGSKDEFIIVWNLIESNIILKINAHIKSTLLT